MKFSIFVKLIILLSLFGCSKNDDVQLQVILKGDYSGTFKRTNSATGWTNTSPVTLSFTDTTFTGTSDQPYFPAICSGKIEESGMELNFINECAWPTHFDWSLILSDLWQFKFTNNRLKIWKESGNITDEYILDKM
jgi:hypothetical protein